MKLTFGARSCGNKCGYIIYKIARSWAVSFYFYFMPFTAIMFSILIPLLAADHFNNLSTNITTDVSVTILPVSLTLTSYTIGVDKATFNSFISETGPGPDVPLCVFLNLKSTIIDELRTGSCKEEDALITEKH